MTDSWTLEEALPLIRILQPQTRQYGYHLCLGGGVLNTGRSEKDLDLYFLPMSPSEGNADSLQAWLDGLWGHGENLVQTLADADPKYPDDPMYQAKLKYDYSGLRIDVFIMSHGGVKQ